MNKTNKELTEAFKRYNDEVFEGSLAKWSVEDMPVRKTFKGDCNEDKHLIRVSMGREDWTETLLHEMCHASVGCEHGHDKTWKAEVRRVSKATGITINENPYETQIDENWHSKARADMDNWINELKTHKAKEITATIAMDTLLFYRKKHMLTADEYKGYKSQIMAYTR